MRHQTWGFIIPLYEAAYENTHCLRIAEPSEVETAIEDCVETLNCWMKRVNTDYVFLLSLQ